MRNEYEIVIADTTCFILLDNIRELNLLKLLFGHVITTTVIAREFGEPLPDWVYIREVDYISLQNSLDIDEGEASAIALAMESQPALLILDDNKARKAALRLNLNFTGSLGVFLKAKEAGIIPAVKIIIEKIQLTNFRYSTAIIDEILRLAGE